MIIIFLYQCSAAEENMIKHVSFKHGWWYFYRVHLQKLDDLLTQEEFPLKNYLLTQFDACPHDYFAVPPRSSSLKFPHAIDLLPVEHHEVSYLAALSHEKLLGKYKAAHSRVEVFFLEHDDKTLAVEVPLWLHPHEAFFFPQLFQTENPLTGHIDILRKEGDFLYVWDYKPKAEKEKYAALQVLFYAYMLSKRTGIPLEKFRCGYFDEQIAYVFQPREEHFQEILSLMQKA